MRKKTETCLHLRPSEAEKLRAEEAATWQRYETKMRQTENTIANMFAEYKRIIMSLSSGTSDNPSEQLRRAAKIQIVLRKYPFARRHLVSAVVQYKVRQKLEKIGFQEDRLVVYLRNKTSCISIMRF